MELKVKQSKLSAEMGWTGECVEKMGLPLGKVNNSHMNKTLLTYTYLLLLSKIPECQNIKFCWMKNRQSSWKEILKFREWTTLSHKIVTFEYYSLNTASLFLGTYFAKHAKYSDTYCVPYSGNRGSSAVQQPRVPVVKIRSVSKNPNLHYTVSVSNPMFGPTVTLQGTGGQASTSNVGPSPVGLLKSNVITTPVVQPTSVPFQQISALHGIGTQMGFGAVTMGTPFGSPQTAQTTGNNHSNPSQSSVADAPKVTADVGQILRVQHKYMFVARVLVGCPGQGRPGLRKPPEDPTDPKGRTFHSCVNSLQKPSIFVIFDSTQCYPEYLIEYVNLISNR